MNAPDFTAALSRAYSARLDAAHHAAQERSEMKDDIAESYRTALLAGNTAAPVECWNRADTLAQVVSEELMDSPGNVLHEILALIAQQYHAGNPLAVHIVDRLSGEHAEVTVDLRSEA